MDKRDILARLGYLNDLATQLEVSSRRLINELLDELEADVVGSEPCLTCKHTWDIHEQTVRWFDGQEHDVCTANMGQGDPCGCEERKPRD